MISGSRKGLTEQGVVTGLTFFDILAVVFQLQELQEREAVSLDLTVNSKNSNYSYYGTMATGV